MTESGQRVLTPFRKPCLFVLLALGVSLSALESRLLVASARPSAVTLKVQRLPGRVDVVLKGLNSEARVVRQPLSKGEWTATLTGVANGFDLRGPQQVVLSSAELLSVRLEPQGADLRVIVKARFGASVPSPQIRSNGQDLILSFIGLSGPKSQVHGHLDLRQPGRVAQPRAVPPMRPRAVAPPLGDMAVGTMLIKNRSFVDVAGPPVTLTLNNAPAKDALMSLARLGGYGFVFVGAAPDQSKADEPVQSGGADFPVTMAFRNEPFDRALNSVLLSSGLQGRLDGGTLLVGPAALSKSFGPQMSRVIRLNQVSAKAAAEYLGNLGATFNLTNTVTTTTGNAVSAGSPKISSETSKKTTKVSLSESFGASVGPLLGLLVTTDSRLQTVTLVGDANLVAVAESYLRQVDLRRRQVALSVRILDIALDNDSQIGNSFAFRSGNIFIVNDDGRLLANFGAYKPPGSELGGLPGRYSAQDGTTPVPGTGSLVGGAVFLDQPVDRVPLPGSGSSRPDFGTYKNPLQPGVSDIDEEGGVTYQAPTRFRYPRDQFFDFLSAQIQSSSTKLLASPTIILQEGGEKMLGSDGSSISSDGKVGRERSNEALVSVGTRLITSFEAQQDVNGNIYCQPGFSNAGLTFGARVDKIDDNGFVTFSLSPEISAEVGIDSAGACGNVSVINSRSLDTGKIRVRDGQTLVLTGVISDSDVREVTKWPLLGDIPIVGQFFRSSAGSRKKNELVVLVTPRVIDDSFGGNYGYGYRPSLPAARQVLAPD